MSDPYAPPGSRPGADQGAGDQQGHGGHGHDPRERRRQLPPSVPHRTSERRPPDPDGQLRTARLGLRFSLCVLAGLVATTSLPLPWSLGGPVFVLVGVAVGVVALVSAARARLRWTSFATLGAGLALALLLLLVQAATLVFWQQTADVQECRASAVTRTGLQQCQEEYQQGLQSFLPRLPTPTPSP
ncbi:hypothetical protein FHN55_21530 [Streptomyces sp. NP160]|uniref:hypothetical protein n=1 Tax=Streptomyces sp. NP160 TaxID=2586637 RepID=UPI00111A55F7|nr:hypothetical protein [Streptomyces sp. NP160]TNM59276.1 hypothetical protein FHN55_21530 [Streptomyces sp. NP160]